MVYKEIETQVALNDILKKNILLENIVFQNVDFAIVAEIAQKKEYNNCLFLGCKLPESWENIKTEKCLIFPHIDVPFNVYISSLYNSQKLYGNYILGKPETFAQTLDQKIYRNYNDNNQGFRNIKNTLAQRIHDHSITEALTDFLSKYNEKKIVAIMGGHQLLRSDREFFEIALLSKKLTERGYLMVSGGGPGAMEATHVGAWFGGKEDKVLEQACKILGEAPDYKNPLWLEKAMQVLSNHPISVYESVGIPTWLYGHEPTTPFASKIAKYFENSIREEGLLKIAKGGIIFTPGSAGTLQEIFQETVQNHYLVYGYASPMIFFGKKYWTDEIPVYTFFQLMIEKGKYKNLIVSIFDETEGILQELNKFSE